MKISIERVAGMHGSPPTADPCEYQPRAMCVPCTELFDLPLQSIDYFRILEDISVHVSV